MKNLLILINLFFSLLGGAQTLPVRIEESSTIFNTFDSKRVITDSIQFITTKAYIIKDSMVIIEDRVFYPSHLLFNKLDTLQYDKNSVVDIIIVEKRNYKAIRPNKVYPAFTMVYTLKLNETLKTITDKDKIKDYYLNNRFYFIGSLKQGAIFFY